jgi:hypothetical protein
MAVLAITQISCTCDFEFHFRGVVRAATGGVPIEGARIQTLWYDLYAIDPEKNNRYGWGEAIASDSAGQLRTRAWGVYDCGPGRADIDDPGDLGYIYFHIEAEGYIPCDVSYAGDSFQRRGGYYIVPDIAISSSDIR